MLWPPAWLAVLSLQSPPAPAVTDCETPSAPWIVEHDATAERRRRVTTGTVRVTAGALQTALGLYVLLAAPTRDSQVTTSGVLNTAAGGGLILHGTLELARRGPLESVVRGPDFAALDDSDESRDWLLQRVRKAARRGYIERNVAGTLSLLAGVTIIGLGIANLADPEADERPALKVLGATEVAAGLGFSSAGVALLFVPSQAESTRDLLERGGNPRSIRPRARVRAFPTLGGFAVTGRF